MRLIDADELKEYIDAFIRVDKHYHPKGKHELIPISEVYDRIEQTPTADVVERKKGKWITKSTFMPDHYGGYYIDQYVCTNCESEFFKPSKFCPNCGADLRGKDEGNN